MEKTEYLVYCGFFIMNYWGERFVQIAKGEFSELPRQKNGRRTPIRKIPSFVYRQDGHELSYEVGGIIPVQGEIVKFKISFIRLISQRGFGRIPLVSQK